MVSSTEIPKAILNTKMVEGFIGTPKYPINPAVITNGSKLGINETNNHSKRTEHICHKNRNQKNG